MKEKGADPMSFSIFTWIIAICWVSLFAKAASWMRRKMAFLHYFSLFPFLLLLSLCMVRIFLFAEFPFTITIESRHILSSICRFLCTPFLSLGRLRLSLPALLALLWLCQTVHLLLWHGRKYYYFRRSMQLLPEQESIRQSDSFQKAFPHGRLQKARIIAHPSIQSPAVAGLCRPMILLPDLDFTEDELLGILLHEGAHYRFGHCIIKCIAEITCASFWWNPFFRELASEIEHALEMQADKAVCRQLTPAQQKKYLEGILKVVSHMGNTRPAPGSPCCLVAERNEDKLQLRFLMILEKQYNKKKKWDAVAIPSILALFLFSYAFVLQPFGEPTIADYGENPEPFPPGYYLVEQEEGYDFYDEKDRLIDRMPTINNFMEMLPVQPEWARAGSQENTDKLADTDEFQRNTDKLADTDEFQENTDKLADMDEFQGNTDKLADTDEFQENTDKLADTDEFQGKEAIQEDTAKHENTAKQEDTEEPDNTRVHGNRTGYKYRFFTGRFCRRLWSYTYQKWEDSSWQPFGIDSAP